MYVIFFKALISLFFSNYLIIFIFLICVPFTGYINNCIEHSNTMLLCLLDCALEYTMDHRGDVGVWVREAAITSLEVCVLFFAIVILLFFLFVFL